MAFFFGGSGIRNAGLAGALDDPFCGAGCSSTPSPSPLAVLSGSMMKTVRPELCLYRPFATQYDRGDLTAEVHGTCYEHFRHYISLFYVCLVHDKLRRCELNTL